MVCPSSFGPTALPPYRLTGLDHIRLQRISGVRYQHADTGIRLQKREATGVPRRHETTLARRHGSEASLAVTAQPEAIPRVGARGVGLHVVDVAGEDEIE